MSRWTAAVVLSAVAGCASAWPAACRDTLSGVRCDCRTVRFAIVPAVDGRPYPAGRVTVLCDGRTLPVVVDGVVVVAPSRP